jgi:hypothetical protein
VAVAGVVAGVTGVRVPHGFGVPVHVKPVLVSLQVTAVFVLFVTVAVRINDWVA